MQNDSEPVYPRIDLVGMDRDDLKGVTDALGEPAYRSRQLYQWIYQRGVTDFAEMHNLSKATRAKLDETYRIGRPTAGTAQQSVDGIFLDASGLVREQRCHSTYRRHRSRD